MLQKPQITSARPTAGSLGPRCGDGGD